MKKFLFLFSIGYFLICLGMHVALIMHPELDLSQPLDVSLILIGMLLGFSGVIQLKQQEMNAGHSFFSRIELSAIFKRRPVIAGIFYVITMLYAPVNFKFHVNESFALLSTGHLISVMGFAIQAHWPVNASDSLI